MPGGLSSIIQLVDLATWPLCQCHVAEVQVYIVGRRFFGNRPLSPGDVLSFNEHTDERGYACLAAFLADGAQPLPVLSRSCPLHVLRCCCVIQVNLPQHRLQSLVCDCGLR
jgi:hypothetical protein